jgi:hypothetical protein
MMFDVGKHFSAKRVFGIPLFYVFYYGTIALYARAKIWEVVQ